VGGQIPNDLAISFNKAGVKILGIPAKMIDDAEDRMKFSYMVGEIGVQQPCLRELTSIYDALDYSQRELTG
jgi:carbamoylphosphate synthase large subunit